MRPSLWRRSFRPWRLVLDSRRNLGLATSSRALPIVPPPQLPADSSAYSSVLTKLYSSCGPDEEDLYWEPARELRDLFQKYLKGENHQITPIVRIIVEGSRSWLEEQMLDHARMLDEDEISGVGCKGTFGRWYEKSGSWDDGQPELKVMETDDLGADDGHGGGELDVDSVGVWGVPRSGDPDALQLHVAAEVDDHQ
ncbi:unnamed protein product [Linum trigynum]|uniref:Uncharacterized protein n=1 Tax=Linum trigynum TaxID=586398 RepID=A0AAV2FL66_9ROSI